MSQALVRVQRSGDTFVTNSSGGRNSPTLHTSPAHHRAWWLQHAPLTLARAHISTPPFESDNQQQDVANTACPYRHNIRITRRHASTARGPTLARHFQQKLIGSQEYCLQIDAHSDFMIGWDSELIQQFDAAKNEFAVLTTYPPDIQQLHRHAATNGQMPGSTNEFGIYSQNILNVLFRR